MDQQAYSVRLVKTGVVTGMAASLFYPMWSFLPIPEEIARLMLFSFGPLLVVSFMAIQHFLRMHRPTVSGDVGAVFGAIAGVLFSTMMIVQLSNTDFIQGYIGGAPDEATAEAFRQILRGVFTVQLGLDVAWDIFICAGTMLVGVAMWTHPQFGKAFAVSGIAVGTSTLALNLYTFPVPPGDANLVDLGPVVGLWFFVVTIQLARSLRWAREASSRAGAPVPT